MARPLSEYFARVYASDAHDYSDIAWPQDDVCDFLCEWDHPAQFMAAPPEWTGEREDLHWVITNPPFRLAEEFICTALLRAQVGVAMLVRTSFLEGQERYRSLFSNTPPALVLQYAERVPMVKGRLDQEASTATSYCWLVFLKKPPTSTKFEWIEPCRSRLEKPGDYPATETEQQPAPLLDWGSQ